MAKKSNPSTSRHLPVPVEMIERWIYLIRSHKVMLDSDLAKLYGVPTSALNQAVRRNLSRFPADFMFQLTKVELEDWKSQIVISNPTARMGLRKSPLAFTEHGILMLSSVLRSERAVQVRKVGESRGQATTFRATARRRDPHQPTTKSLPRAISVRPYRMW